MSKCLSLVVKTQTSSKDKYSTSAFQTLAVLFAPLNKYLGFQNIELLKGAVV